MPCCRYCARARPFSQCAAAALRKQFFPARARDIIMDAKMQRLPLARAAVLLRQAHTAHMRLHREVYGNANLKPKHHWMFDCADQMQRDAEAGMKSVVDCFIVERLHLRVKARARNCPKMERSVGDQIYTCICLPVAFAFSYTLYEDTRAHVCKAFGARARPRAWMFVGIHMYVYMFIIAYVR